MNKYEEYRLTKKQIEETFNIIKDKFSVTDSDLINEFIEHNEWVLAFETLCYQINHYRLEISQEYYDKIASLGKNLGLELEDWSFLEKLITKS